jgi:uncharacterized OB-fold protein
VPDPPPSAPDPPHSVEEWMRGYEEEGVLRGFRCRSCGLVTATWGIACLRCGTPGLEEAQLAPRGTVVSFTLLSVPGDEFLNDAPYAYVVVDLDGGGRITGWMPAAKTESDVRIGDRVRFAPSYKPGVQFVRETEPGGPG